MGNKWDPVVGTAEYNENLVILNKVAQEQGLALNPDQERIRKAIGLMTTSKIEFDKYYCPCKQNHPLDSKKDALCPCPEMKHEIAKDNRCFCRLFYKPRGA